MIDDVFVNKLLESLLKSAKWGSILVDLFRWVSAKAGDDDEIELEAIARALPDASERLRQKSADWLDLFRKLEGANYGNLILGRRGFKTRFRWREPPIRLAQRALNRDPASEPVVFHMVPEPSDVPTEEVDHPFPLRRDMIVHVRVPADITRDELQRLAEFTKLLPAR